MVVSGYAVNVNVSELSQLRTDELFLLLIVVLSESKVR